MKDEITRIMKLVKEGKISPEDAAELIDAFTDTPERDAEPEPAAASAATEARSEADGESQESQDEKKAAENPFASLISAIEGITKEVTTKVDWKDIAGQVSKGVSTSVDAIKKAAEDAKVGQGFRFIFGSHESKIVEMPLLVPEGKTLRIEASSGNVSVSAAEGLGSYKVKAVFHAASPEDAKKKASLYTPVMEESDQQVTLKLQEGPDSEVDATIMVPAGTSVDIRTTSGRVSVKGITGSVRVQGASADFEGAGLRGAIEVGLASGDIHIGDADGASASLETKSGDIGLTEVRGALTVRTSSGDVHMTRCSGRTVSVESASGDVHLDLDRPVLGSLNVRAVSGDVKVDLSDGSDAKVSLSAVQGQVNCGFELAEKAQASGKLTGRLGEGGGVIDLSTVCGDVILSMRDNPTTEVKEEKPEDGSGGDDPLNFHLGFHQ